MSLLNTSSSVMHYIVLGELPFGYGAAVFGVGALGEYFHCDGPLVSLGMLYTDQLANIPPTM